MLMVEVVCVDVIPNKAGKERSLRFMFQNIVKARKLLWIPLLALGLAMVNGPLSFKSHWSKCRIRRMWCLFSLGGLLIRSHHRHLTVCRKCEGPVVVVLKQAKPHDDLYMNDVVVQESYSECYFGSDTS